jgi:hypothetical protein
MKWGIVTPPEGTVRWPHPDLTITAGDGLVLTLYPHIAADAIEGWGDGEFPALKRAALASADPMRTILLLKSSTSRSRAAHHLPGARFEFLVNATHTAESTT